MATTGDKELEAALKKLKECFHANKYVYPMKLHDMLTSEPDFSGRCSFDENLEAELYKVIPYLELHASSTKRYPRWPLPLENVLRLKYPGQHSLGEHEQLYCVTLWHLAKLDNTK